MKKSSLEESEVIGRTYGIMRMLAGGYNLPTQKGDLRILEIEAGRPTSLHHHEESESIFHVIEGELAMEVNGASIPLERGATIVIEPGEVHRLRNTSTQKAIVMECMAPPFSKRDIFYREGDW